MYPLIRNALILLCALLPPAVYAVTLGEARVKSYLNQPLDAEIDLVGLAEGQNEQLRLRLANQEYFDRLGIAYTSRLEDLEFDVIRSGNRWLVRARSNRAINEPFLDFPLMMSWPGGQMIRQYTLLLDPPTFTQAAAPQVSAPSRTSAAAAAASRASSRVATRRIGGAGRITTLSGLADVVGDEGLAIHARQLQASMLDGNDSSWNGPGMFEVLKGVRKRQLRSGSRTGSLRPLNPGPNAPH